MNTSRAPIRFDVFGSLSSLALLFVVSAQAGISPKVVVRCKIDTIQGNAMLLDCGENNTRAYLKTEVSRFSKEFNPHPGQAVKIGVEVSDLSKMAQEAWNQFPKVRKAP